MHLVAGKLSVVHSVVSFLPQVSCSAQLLSLCSQQAVLHNYYGATLYLYVSQWSPACTWISMMTYSATHCFCVVLNIVALIFFPCCVVFVLYTCCIYSHCIVFVCGACACVVFVPIALFLCAVLCCTCVVINPLPVKLL